MQVPLPGNRLCAPYGLDESPPDHSSISRTRRRLDLETHEEVFGWRTYMSEPRRGRRRWAGRAREREAVYANRRRIRGERGKRLLRKRGELLERAFTHYLDGVGMRRTHLRRHDNILKRLMVHVAGFNLGLVMRKLVGRGTPRGLAAALSRLFGRLLAACGAVMRVGRPEAPRNRRLTPAALHPAAA